MPALNNNLVNLVKTTTQALAIAVPELLYQMISIYNDYSTAQYACMLFMFFAYIILVGILVFGMHRWERALQDTGVRHMMRDDRQSAGSSQGSTDLAVLKPFKYSRGRTARRTCSSAAGWPSFRRGSLLIIAADSACGPASCMAQSNYTTGRRWTRCGAGCRCWSPRVSC